MNGRREKEFNQEAAGAAAASALRQMLNWFFGTVRGERAVFLF